KTHKESALWTNSMFGGMPTTFIASPKYQNLVPTIHRLLGKIVAYPFVSFLIGLIGFYILLLVFGVNPWIAMVGSIAYNMVTINFILISTGHNNKFLAISVFSWLIAGMVLVFKKKRILGGILFTLALCWELGSSHVQMTYYLIYVCIAIIITEFIVSIKQKKVKRFLGDCAILFVGVLLAVSTYAGKMWSEYEYSKYTIRGGSELTPKDNNSTGGLDRDYILSYSYDVGEALSAFIPRIKGGSMMEPLSEDSEVFKIIAKSQGRPSARKICKRLPVYWGSQPIVGAPFYFGAVLCFLFVLGLFVIKGKIKWWIVSIVIISFLLSLGKNFSLLSNFFIDYVPLYNKFRDVKNIVVIQVFAMGLLGVLGLKEIFERKLSDKEFKKKLGYAFAITGGLALILALIPGLVGNFTGSSDAQLAASGWPQQLIDALQMDRESLLRADAFRSFIFVAIAAAGIWAFWKKKLKAQYALALWVVLILADLWPVNKRYLNNDNFSPAKEVSMPFKKQKADIEILKDKDLSYRVLTLQNPFQDARTSYFHKSIGGYHAAKLGRYQELIEHHISPEMQQMVKGLQSRVSIDSVFSALPVINMLNTRYIIYDLNRPPLRNPVPLGNAWFVGKAKIVENADEEIAALNGFDPASVAIVDQRFAKNIEGKNFTKDLAGSITLTEYQPNYLKYAYQAASEQLTVFSEIYYDKGWKAFIDGQEVPHFRVDYVLRAMVIPPGKHTIEFKFEPRSYYLGNKISLVSSIILLLLIAGYFGYEIKRRLL
ncbi:hypothetical protein MNBD_BACTEROID01-2201, partial [hydrothermal vent metagenome]